MPDRRELVLDAAVRVLASGGTRALTHRAVDAEAGVPTGTTSNHFRTRSALVTGIADHLEQRDRAFLAEGAPGELTVEALPGLVAAYVMAQLADPEPQRARLALALEPEADLAAQHLRLCELATEMLTELGVSEARPTALALVDLIDGALLHALTIPGREVDPAAIAQAVARLIGR